MRKIEIEREKNGNRKTKNGNGKREMAKRN